MTFDRPVFFWLLLALPLVWLWARKKIGMARISCALKSAVFAILVLALAGPRSELPERHLAVTVVTDASASMPRESLDQSQALLRDLLGAKSNADLHVVSFAGDAQLDPASSDPQAAISDREMPASAMETNIARGIDLALSSFPPAGARRIVLVTDGNQTRGDALAAALRARAAGVQIFTAPSGGISRLPVELTGISAPQNVFSGERFTVSVELESSQAISGTLIIATEGRRNIASRAVQLNPGSNSAEIDARITDTGVEPLELSLQTQGVTQSLYSQAIAVRKPHVLYVAGKDGPSDPLLTTLDQAQVDVEKAVSFPVDPAAANWDAVILDDYPSQPLPPEEGAALTKYVSSGGGLLFIGGDRNAQLAKEPTTPLEKLLPVKGDPNPAPEQPTALVLVLDKSLSMEGPKIAMVRQAARASVAALRPKDKVGLIAFDKEFRWVVPVTPVSEATGIDAAIQTIEAGGGTRIYPAVEAAYDAIATTQATRKHIILLTDGMSPPGDLPTLEASALINRVTISTIGVGDDVDSKFLQDIADSTRGKSYFIQDPYRITEIVDDETKNLENTEIVEKPFRALSVRPMELTDGIDFSRAPELLGFVKTKARTGAETILRTSTGEPLLARWQFGLGRVAAFLSDSRPRWSAGWVGWHSYGTFWPQVVRDMSRRDAVVRSGVRFAGDNAETTVTYDITEGPDKTAATVLENLEPLSVAVTAPDTTTMRLALHRTAPNHYEAAIDAQQSGLYRVAASATSPLLPPVGFVRSPEELKSQAINFGLLQQIARLTGGAVNPTVAQLLDPRGSQTFASQPLWPYLVVLAILSNLFELAWRKGHFETIMQWLRRKVSLHQYHRTAARSIT